MKAVVIQVVVLLFSGIISRAMAQNTGLTISGIVKEKLSGAGIPFANVTLKKEKDSSFVSATITTEEGRFRVADVSKGDYLLEISHTGFVTLFKKVSGGSLNTFLDVGTIELLPDTSMLEDVVITSKKNDPVNNRMDKKVFSLSENISQAGSSVLQAVKNLPGITVGDDGKLRLRGSDKVAILLDSKQSALTGFGNQSNLDNIPASAIDRIEIITNPSARYDANGNAGIINIIYKKQKKEGWNGKIGLSGGLGALRIKQENYPGIRPQYQSTPKINPTFSLNYRKNKFNLFFQGDDLYTKTLNKNEFTDRIYADGDTIKQQLKRNRTTNMFTIRSGVDYTLNNYNTITISGLFGSEKILDRGDEPFFNGDLSERKRLWQFLEDELKTTVTANASWQRTFRQPGRSLQFNISYTFHREDEKYFFTNTLPASTGLDSFKLISDEHVLDLGMDYIQPLRNGRFETGFKFRRRYIPTNMQFKPGLQSPLDSNAGGWATYAETIPAVYGSYIYEQKDWEVEAGVRLEYVGLEYDVNPNHPVYKSDGYNYFQPFPNVRVGYKINDHHKLSLFYNRRVDRPNEVDIRIFPKYDDAEIIKVGNPTLRPQYTNSAELSYKYTGDQGYLVSSLYHKRMAGTIARIGSLAPGSSLIYNIFQNAGKSYNTGAELMALKKLNKHITVSINLNGYHQVIDSFTVVNKYPVENTYHAGKEKIFSGNIKINSTVSLPQQVEMQITAIYQAPELVPQGKVFSRFSIDAGIRKTIQKGKGELFANATDIAGTLRIKREVQGNGFRYTSVDYMETQVFRIGYNYKF